MSVAICIIFLLFLTAGESYSSVGRVRNAWHKSSSNWCVNDGLISPSLDAVHVDISPATFLSKGVVLLAQPTEFNHFLIKAAILVYDYGSEKGSKGVILERATAFSMGETSPNSGPFEPNTLYLGGEDGKDTALMFHKYDLPGYSKYVGAGIYQGGLKAAKMLVESEEASAKDFKFIFNSVEWAPGGLEMEVEAGRWDIANVPPSLILQQSSASASLWSKARNTLRSLGGLIGDDNTMINDDDILDQDIEDDDDDEESYPI
jgi:putative AlgH/UPF0301 family transcriptional regulator